MGWHVQNLAPENFHARYVRRKIHRMFLTPPEGPSANPNTCSLPKYSGRERESHFIHGIGRGYLPVN
jgi:hypothetical protein